MSPAVVLAKSLPSSVTDDFHTLLENALWVVLIGCIASLMVAGGCIAWAKHSGQTVWIPSSRVLRALVSGAIASTALQFAMVFSDAIK